MCVEQAYPPEIKQFTESPSIFSDLIGFKINAVEYDETEKYTFSSADQGEFYVIAQDCEGIRSRLFNWSQAFCRYEGDTNHNILRLLIDDEPRKDPYCSAWKNAVFNTCEHEL